MERTDGIYNIADISTAHVTYKDIKLLEDGELWFVIAEYPEGVMINIPSAYGMEEFIQEAKEAGLSDSFVQLIKYCVKHNVLIARLDKDGTEVDDLIIHDW